MKKLLVVGVIVLFLGVSVIPSTGNMVFNDDTTPPVTTCALDPPEPDGDNGWYVNDVNVTLNATDDMSGVKEIKYRVGSGSWQTITGDNGSFIVDEDGNDIPIEYYAIDNAGNEETHQIVKIDKDQTKPDIALTLETYKENGIWYILFTATCNDATSGMDRVEFYMDDELVCTDDKAPYEWTYTVPFISNVIGLILNPQSSEENITFFALIVIITNEHDSSSVYSKHFNATAYDMAGNSETDDISSPCYIPPGIYMFQHLTFPNNYTGHMGRFFIRATFEYAL